MVQNVSRHTKAVISHGTSVFYYYLLLIIILT